MKRQESFKKGMSRLDFQINKSILIVKSQENSLLAVEAFLKNRDWKIHSTIGLKEALLYLVNNQPMFVLISTDHPNPKVQNLPRILASAFPVCVIMFAENTSPAAYRKLSGHPAEYKLFPPVSGPAVERVVNKYIKDQNQKAADAAIRQREGGLTKEEESVISVKGSSGGDNTLSFSSTNAQNLLKTMLAGGESGDDEIAGHVSSHSTSDDDESSSSDANRAQKSSSSAGGHWAPIDTPMQKQKGMGRGEELSTLQKNRKTGESSATQEDEDSDEFLAKQNGEDSSNLDPANAGKKGGYQRPTSAEAPAPQYSEDDFLHPEGTGKASLVDEEEAKENKAPDVRENEESGLGKTEVNFIGKEKDNRHYSEKEDSPIKVKDHFYHDRGEETLIAKGAQEALDKSVTYVKGAKTQAIEQSTNVACIVIDSTRFSGYLVAAMGKDRKIDEEFIEKIRSRLIKFLKENGEIVEGNDSSMNIKIKQVDFEDWAVDCAEFLRKSIHKGDEVAMAFFPHSEAKTKAGESAARDMATVSIDDVKSDTPLDFGVYVYLPKNGRYVLYTPAGGKLLSKQKDKLVSQGVTELHVKKEDLQKISGHRAQTYLNDQIDKYVENKTLKNPEDKSKKSA